MVLSSLVFLLIDAKDRKSTAIKWTLFGLSFTLLLLSHSDTSLITILILLLLSQLYKIITFAPKLRIGLYFILICIVITIIPYSFNEFNSLLATLGRNSTLSGRTEVWSVIIDMIKLHPILGYGYNSIWIAGHKLDYIQSMVNWPVTHSHNGYLDICLNIGAIGLSVFLIGFFRTFCTAIRNLPLLKFAHDFWPLMYITFLFIYNLTETAILTNNSIFWALYVASTMSLVTHYLHTAPFAPDEQTKEP